MTSKYSPQPIPKGFDELCRKVLAGLPEKELPSTCKSYEHTCAGQGIKDEQKGTVLGLPDDGLVFKPLQQDPKGLHELFFYMKVFHGQSANLQVLRPFLSYMEPCIFVESSEKKENLKFTGKYLCLEDALKGLKCPCVCDVKNGAISFTPDSTRRKMRRQVEKYPYRQEVGFYIPGMRIYNPITDGYALYQQNYGKQLTPEKVYEYGILKFLQCNPNRASLVAGLILDRLLHLRTFFQEQREWTFVASSFLLAYEGDPVRWTNAEEGLCSVNDLVVVKLIDFTHTYPNAKHSIDENYLYGLNKLIAHFEKAKAQACNREVVDCGELVQTAVF